MKKPAKRQQVKILGQVVTVGSKEWEKLTYRVKLFNQDRASYVHGNTAGTGHYDIAMSDADPGL